MKLIFVMLSLILTTGCASQAERIQNVQAQGFSAEAAQRIVTGQTTETQERIENYKIMAEKWRVERQKYCSSSARAFEQCRIENQYYRYRPYMYIPRRSYYYSYHYLRYR